MASSGRTPTGGKRPQAGSSPDKPAAKRGRGAIASAPPSRGQGRGRKRGGGLAAIAEERPALGQKRLRASAAARGDSGAGSRGDSEHSSEGGELVRIDDIMSSASDSDNDSRDDTDEDEFGDEAVVAPARRSQRQRRSVAQAAHTILEDDDNDDSESEVGKQGRGHPAGLPHDSPPDERLGTVSNLHAPPAEAPASRGSLLERLLSQRGPSSQPMPSLPVSQSLPAPRQESPEALPSPVHGPHASSAAPAQLGGGSIEQDTASAIKPAAAAAPDNPVSASGAGAPPASQAGGRISLKQKYAELKAMRARQA